MKGCSVTVLTDVNHLPAGAPGWDARKFLRRAGFAFFGVLNGTELNPTFHEEIAAAADKAQGAVLICACSPSAELEVLDCSVAVLSAWRVQRGDPWWRAETRVWTRVWMRPRQHGRDDGRLEDQGGRHAEQALTPARPASGVAGCAHGTGASVPGCCPADARLVCPAYCHACCMMHGAWEHTWSEWMYMWFSGSILLE